MPGRRITNCQHSSSTEKRTNGTMYRNNDRMNVVCGIKNVIVVVSDGTVNMHNVALDSQLISSKSDENINLVTNACNIEQQIKCMLLSMLPAINEQVNKTMIDYNISQPNIFYTKAINYYQTKYIKMCWFL